MTSSDLPTLPDSIRLVDDLHQGLPHIIGTYALLGDEPALVDPGPTSTLTNLEAGLLAQGVSLDDIRVLLLTHIHLDHAGSTGTLVARYPHLRVYVHHRGAPHLIAPERLLRSAARLYGSAMDQLWGEFRAVPKQNITTLAGGETIRLGSHTLHVYDAPGHASHHVIYFEDEHGLAFVGDTAGVHVPGAPSVRPPTPPPDIDLEGWRSSLDQLRALDPNMLLLTHFGPVSNPLEHIEDFYARLMRWSETVREGLNSGADEETQIARLRAVAEADLGLNNEIAQQSQYASPIEQSWQGLARYWRKRMEPA